MKYLNKKTSFILAIVVMTVAFSFYFWPQISLGLKTVGVTINLLIPKGNWRPLELFTKKPIREEFFIESSSGRKLTLNIYQPKKSQELKTAIIIYTPFIGAGLDDFRLVNLANTFARAGFIVAVPWRSEDHLIISTKDAEDVISVALFLKNKSELKTNKIGLWGISYGNGPMIVASVDSRIKDFISFIVSFAGYYDFQSALEFVVSGDSDPYAKEILNKTLKYYNTDEETFLRGTEFEKLKKGLSPSSLIDQLTADFFITHSIDDRYIPYTESIKLADALRLRSGQVTFALTTVFEHGAYKKFNFENVRRHYLPSVADFYKFLFVLISKHL